MRCLSRFALAGFTAASLACGLTAATIQAADASSAAATAKAAPAAAAARAALARLHVGRPIQGKRAPGAVTHAANGLTQVEYFNWSGYGDTNSGKQVYSQVAGSWTQPSVSCTKEDQVVVTWVGLDGLTDGTVEQDGTLAQCFQGTAFYYTWWEMFPTNDIQLVGSTVRPGDKVTSSVVRKGTSQLRAQGHRCHQDRQQLRHHPDLRGLRRLRQFERRVDRRGADRPDRAVPAGRFPHLAGDLRERQHHRQVRGNRHLPRR